jgi:hypothetical protein
MKNSYKHWKKYEIEIIKKQYPYEPKEKILKLIKRSWSAIMRKAHKLGLHRISLGSFPKQMKELTDFQKGYLAGMIDGEGTVSIHWITIKGKKRPIPIVQISNTNKAVLEKIKEFTGIGHINTSYKYNAYNPRVKPCYKWIVRNKIEIFQFLTQIKDLLIIKKPQAELLVKYLKNYKPFFPNENNLKLALKMKVLNSG